MSNESRHLKTVRAVLSDYTSRGVIGGIVESHLRKNVTQFQFVWMYRRKFTIELNEDTATLTFRDCFPHVASQRDLHGGIIDFLKSRDRRDLPGHRRLDTSRAEVGCRKRNGSVSLFLKVKRNQYRYGAKKLVNLLHETFYMIDECFTDYLHEHFDLPEE